MSESGFVYDKRPEVEAYSNLNATGRGMGISKK